MTTTVTWCAMTVKIGGCSHFVVNAKCVTDRVNVMAWSDCKLTLKHI